jgi:hypothetical protein
MVAGFEAALFCRRAANPDGIRLSARSFTGYPNFRIQAFHSFGVVIFLTGISVFGTDFIELYRS